MDNPGTYNAAQYQADTFRYAIAEDDIIVDGAVFAASEWESDREGGVQPRGTWAAYHAADWYWKAQDAAIAAAAATFAERHVPKLVAAGHHPVIAQEAVELFRRGAPDNDLRYAVACDDDPEFMADMLADLIVLANQAAASHTPGLRM